jgi:hypothetical protein
MITRPWPPGSDGTGPTHITMSSWKAPAEDRTVPPAAPAGKTPPLVPGTGPALPATPGGSVPGSVPLVPAADLAGGSVLAPLSNQSQKPDPLPAGPAAQRPPKRRFGLSTGLPVGQKPRVLAGPCVAQDPVTQERAQWVGYRRDLVNPRTAVAHKLTATLKLYYPLALELWQNDTRPRAWPPTSF